MEFIDPEQKRKKARRLKIGYSLLTVLVGLATYILVATAMGFEVIQRDGRVIQNGIVFLDSKPVSVDVFINGVKEDNKTDTRLVLAEGEYEVVFKANGYKDWTKKILLNGGTVQSLTYPRLFPENLKSTDLKTYEGSNSGLYNQSPNNRWIIFQPNKNTANFNIIDTTKPNIAQQELDIPPTILGSPDGKVGALEIVEWANDNRHILIKHTIDNTPPIFIILDKDDLAKSINLNSLFNIQPSKVSLLGGKLDKAYIYLASGGILKIGDIKTKILSDQLYDQVLDFKQINEERLMYVTTKNSTSGKVVVNATNKENEFLIGETEFDPSSKYYLGAGEYSGDWYYVIGTSLSERVHIYRNPQNFVASERDNTPNILTTLRSGLPLYVSFSPGKRFIVSQSDKIYTVYDVVEKKSYKTPIIKPLDSGTTISWVDEYILQYSQGGELNFIEFDGQNSRKLINIKPPFKGYIDGSFSRLYTLRNNDSAVTSQLTTLTVGD